MKRITELLLLAAVAALPLAANSPADKLQAAERTIREIMDEPDDDIPMALLDKAECIGIIPSLKKGAFIVGGKYGQGAMLCREGASWTAPSMVKIEGGSFGLQIGGGEVDVILLVMNEQGKQKLMSTEFTLGGTAGVMAGPTGRTAKAETDAAMHAEILSYSSSKGVFAGIALEGGTLRADPEENRKLYGREVSHKAVLQGDVPRPDAALGLIQTIEQYADQQS